MPTSSLFRLFGFSLVLGSIFIAFFGLPYGALFLLVGLFGVTKIQYKKFGLLSIASLLLIALGLISSIAVNLLPGRETQSVTIFFLNIAVSVVLLLPGYFLLVVTLIRSGVFPPALGMLLIIGILAVLVMGRWGGYLLYGDLTWLGYLILSGKIQEELTPLPGEIPL